MEGSAEAACVAPSLQQTPRVHDLDPTIALPVPSMRLSGCTGGTQMTHHQTRQRPPRARGARTTRHALLVSLLALAFLPAVAGSAAATPLVEERAFEPFTPWRQPPMQLPTPVPMDYASLAEGGVRQAGRWRSGRWYCEYLACAHGPYPLLTIWGEVPMFEAVDAVDAIAPSRSHRALVDHFARASERYWNRAIGGYAPYPKDRGSSAEAWFDDNGWLGLAFLNAYRVTHERRYLRDAQRAFSFAATKGWDPAGGMWWNTDHPYHSGPALAADSLLGILLYAEDGQPWQIAAVQRFVDWANANDTHDERQFYLEQPNQPESVNDYVQAPLIYTQYLLCRDGAGEGYCVRAGRTAATLAETNVTKAGFRYNYGPEYDTIYLQWMMAYGEATGDPYWLRLAQLNAEAAAANATGSGGLWLASWWGGPIDDPETHSNMFRTMAATTSLFAWVGLYSSEHEVTPTPLAAPARDTRSHAARRG